MRRRAAARSASFRSSLAAAFSSSAAAERPHRATLRTQHGHVSGEAPHRHAAGRAVELEGAAAPPACALRGEDGSRRRTGTDRVRAAEAVPSVTIRHDAPRRRAHPRRFSGPEPERRRRCCSDGVEGLKPHRKAHSGTTEARLRKVSVCGIDQLPKRSNPLLFNESRNNYDAPAETARNGAEGDEFAVSGAFPKREPWVEPPDASALRPYEPILSRGSRAYGIGDMVQGSAGVRANDCRRPQ